MSFQLNESLTLLQMELVAKRFFEFLSDMDIEKGLNPPIIKQVSENHLGSVKHQVLIAIYRAFFALINRSLAIKQSFINMHFTEEAVAIAEMNELVTKLFNAMDGLKAEGYEDILMYFLKGERGRHIIYYLMTLHYFHQNVWEHADGLKFWIDGLISYGEPCEQQLIDIYHQIMSSGVVLDTINAEQVSDSNVYLTKNFDPHHYVVALFAIEEQLSQYPVYHANIPSYFYKLIQLKLSCEYFDCFSRCDEKTDYYQQLIERLKHYNFIPKVYSKHYSDFGKLEPISWLLGYMEYYHLNLSFYCSKDHISEQTIRINHLSWRLYLAFNEELAFDAFYSLALNALNFLSHGHLPEHPSHREKFMDATFKLYTKYDCHKEAYLHLLSKSSLLMVYLFLSVGRASQAIEMLNCLMHYNQLGKRKLLAEKTQNYHELINVLKFIIFYNATLSLEDEIKIYYQFIDEKILVVKEFKPKNCFKNLIELVELIKQLFMNKMNYLAPQLKLMPKDRHFLDFQHYIFLLAKAFEVSDAESKLLESYFKVQEIKLEDFDEKTASDKRVSPVSLFQDSRKMIHKSSLPKAIIQLYELLKAFKQTIQQDEHTYLWLFGGQVRHLYLTEEVKADADYDLKAWKLNLSAFMAFLQEHKFGHSQLIEAHVPVIRLKVLEEEQIIEMDIQSFGHDELHQEKALQTELLKCDFTVSSAYMEINLDKQFEIKGYNKAIQCLNKKMITLNHPDAMSKDPLILLRLVHLCLSDLDLKVSHQLSEILKSGEPQQALKLFLEDDLHCRQFVTQLKKSLVKVEARASMIRLMEEFGIFEIWTGLTLAEIEEGMKHLPALDPQLKLSIPLQVTEYLYLYLSMKLGSFEAVKSSVLHRITKSFAPLERLFFRYIDQILWGIDMKDFVNAPDILLLKDFVQQTYFQAQNLQLSSA